MRYRLMATYQGVPYEAGIGPSDGDVVLFAACPPPEELGFEPATGHWRKELRMQDVQALWESKPTGRYRGQRCLVLDDLGDRLHIAYLGHDAYQAHQLGYWQVDRGVFELVTPRDEVTEVTEERFDYPEPSGPPGGPGAAPDYDPVTADLGPVTADLGPPPGFGQPSGPGPVIADYGPATADFAVRARAGQVAAPTAADAAASSPGLPRPDPPPRPGFTVLPPASEPPLPLEAEALRAASAAALPREARPAPDVSPPPAPPAVSPPPAPPAVQVPPAVPEPGPPAPPAVSPPWAAPAVQVPPAVPEPGPLAPAGAEPRRRRSARSRMATQRIFTELATLAAIPAAAYAVGEEVDGALCLIETDAGYEVFSAAGGARHEVRVFDDEESAYFYLFGVLAAEAVRTGQLISHR